MDFGYSNLNDRPPGKFLAVAGRVVPGIAWVQADVEPFAAYWRRANTAALASTAGPLWVALGDSLTLGVGASAPDLGWVGQLAARLTTDGQPYRVVNLAVSGALTHEVIERQLPVLDTLPADLITVMVGSNDLMRPRMRRGLAVRFTRLADRLPRGSVVATLANPTRAARRANAALTEVAAARGLVVAELRDRRTISWRRKLAADHFHPNDRGYEAIANVMGEFLPTARRTVD
jgi:lysophospholipase L1-like esterase